MLSEIERKAWDKRQGADAFPPAMAARVTVDRIARGEFPNLSHVVVVVVQTDEEGDYIEVLQTGNLTQLGVEGALHRAVSLSSQRTDD